MDDPFLTVVVLLQVVNFPFNDVIKYGHRFLDSINIFGAKTNETIWQAIKAGVPKEKVILNPLNT